MAEVLGDRPVAQARRREDDAHGGQERERHGDHDADVAGGEALPGYFLS